MTTRTAHRLLAIATTFCGPDVTRRVFDPLVADWAREWDEARGLRRGVVAGLWGAAYARSLLRCADVRLEASVSQPRAFAFILAVFAGAFVVTAVLPVVMWRHWMPATLQVGWRGIDFDTLLMMPERFVLGIVLALVPASMLVASVQWPMRKWAAACALALACVVALDGWVVPAALQVRTEQFWARAGREVPPQASGQPTLAAYVRMAQSDDPLVASHARHQLRSKARILVSAAALALLGAAVGRARRRRDVRVGPGALAAWWLMAAGAWLGLGYWAPYFSGAVGVAPELAAWLPPALIALVGVTAMLPGQPAAVVRE